MLKKILFLFLAASLMANFFVPRVNADKYTSTMWRQVLFSDNLDGAASLGAAFKQYPNGTLNGACSDNCLVATASDAASGTHYFRLGGSTRTDSAIIYPATYENSGHTGGISLPNADRIVLSFDYRVTTTDTSDDDGFWLEAVDYSRLGGNMGEYNNLMFSGKPPTWQTAYVDLTIIKGATNFIFGLVVDNDNLLTTTDFDNFNITAYYNDTIRPTGTIRINNGARSTRRARVTLNLAATDNASGVAKMRFSNNGKKWSRWYTYKTTKRWNLTDSKYGGTTRKGIKRVYVQFRDGMGHVSRKRSDTIRYR